MCHLKASDRALLVVDCPEPAQRRLLSGHPAMKQLQASSRSALSPHPVFACTFKLEDHHMCVESLVSSEAAMLFANCSFLPNDAADWLPSICKPKWSVVLPLRQSRACAGL
jgi:hypothetical protein